MPEARIEDFMTVTGNDARITFSVAEPYRQAFADAMAEIVRRQPPYTSKSRILVLAVIEMAERLRESPLNSLS